MNLRTYLLVSGIVFVLVGLLHLVRAAAGWPLVVGPFDMPLAASWMVGLFACALGAIAYRKLRLSVE